MRFQLKSIKFVIARLHFKALSNYNIVQLNFSKILNQVSLFSYLKIKLYREKKIAWEKIVYSQAFNLNLYKSYVHIQIVDALPCNYSIKLFFSFACIFNNFWKDGAYIFSLELWNTLTQSVKDVLETATTWKIEKEWTNCYKENRSEFLFCHSLFFENLEWVFFALPNKLTKETNRKNKCVKSGGKR